VAARLKPLALAAVATALVGASLPSRSETTVTAERP
jgi:hypothetical protein